MKTDITMYGDSELSLLFLNEEPLYRDLCACVKRGLFEYLEEIVRDNFIYTPEQLDDLRETFEQEKYEEENI